MSLALNFGVIAVVLDISNGLPRLRHQLVVIAIIHGVSNDYLGVRMPFPKFPYHFLVLPYFLAFRSSTWNMEFPSNRPDKLLETNFALFFILN